MTRGSLRSSNFAARLALRRASSPVIYHSRPSGGAEVHNRRLTPGQPGGQVHHDAGRHDYYRESRAASAERR